MEDPALLAVMKTIFTPAVKYPLPDGVRPLREDPQKEEILAAMPACNALGIEGRTDSEPQATKAKAPSSSGEDEETSESEEESAESSEEDSIGELSQELGVSH